MNWSPQPRASRREPWDAESLAEQWPHIEWREPVLLSAGGHTGLLCRICTANHGFKAEDVDKLPKTREAFAEHMAEAHPS